MEGIDCTGLFRLASVYVCVFRSLLSFSEQSLEQSPLFELYSDVRVHTPLVAVHVYYTMVRLCKEG